MGFYRHLVDMRWNRNNAVTFFCSKIVNGMSTVEIYQKKMCLDNQITDSGEVLNQQSQIAV